MSTPSGPTTTQRPSPPAPEPDVGPVRWYRRRAFLVAAGAAVVVGAAIISDLPAHTSRATDIQAESTVISEINTDVAPCIFSVREALTLYSDESGPLPSANRAQIPGLLGDDQNACSFTDESIFDLSDLEVPGTRAGKQVGQAVNTVTVWATSDALAAIEAVQGLTSHPGDQRTRSKLLADERLLGADRDKATAEIDATGRDLGTHLPRLNVTTESLPGVPRP